MDVYRITYKNRAWEIRSDRFYSADSVIEALSDFLYCFSKGRVGEKRLSIKKMMKFNRWNGIWESVITSIDLAELAHIDTDVSISINKDNTISLRRDITIIS